jgi:histidinol-phosphate aminotransferase
MNLNRFFRPNILGLRPYSCARDEFDGDGAIFLDANESPWPNGCNRYPDPRHTALRERIAEIYGIPAARIVLGNGSDELIDMLIRSACRPVLDNVVVFSPGYAMYEVSAAVNEVGVIKLDLAPDFLPDERALAAAVNPYTKLIFLCSPNNPTGNVIPQAVVERICDTWPDTMVVVDQAYIDFADAPSATALLDRVDNLFVLQTLSKAWGMAGLRIGIGIGREPVVAVLNKVKAPYNIGSTVLLRAFELLGDTAGFAARVAETVSQRERLADGLRALGVFRRVYPSEANFLLAIADRPREIYDFLASRGVVTRLRDIPPLIAGGLRITVGTAGENDRLLELLNEWKKR